jgi:hypothetical protein
MSAPFEEVSGRTFLSDDIKDVCPLSHIVSIVFRAGEKRATREGVARTVTIERKWDRDVATDSKALWTRIRKAVRVTLQFAGAGRAQG